MRFETHRVSEYVVRWLLAAHSVSHILVDGGDIIEFALTSGQYVSLHLIESDLGLSEAGQILRANDARGFYTLFLFWRDMLLPDHGHIFQMDNWLSAWAGLYGGKVYGYDFNWPDVYLFSIHFDPLGAQWVARFGPTVDPARLVARQVHTTGPLAGFWRVAAFDGDEAASAAGTPRALDDCYRLLGLEPGAPRTLVKRAYRRQARRLHPDVNPSADAHQRMQALNDAYRLLLDYLDGAAYIP